MQQAKEQREGVGGAAVNFQAETVIAEVGGVNTGVGHSEVFLEGDVIFTATAGATTVTIRVRREGIAGAEVGKVEVAAVKAAKQSIGFNFKDVPSTELANCTYVLTAASGAAENQPSANSRLSATF